MSLSNVIKNAVAAVKTATASIQASITLETFLDDDSNGNRSYNTAATYGVIFEQKTRWVSQKDRNGESQLSKANIQFLEQVTLMEQDRITLPDGSQPQIISIEGVADENGAIYCPRVYF